VVELRPVVDYGRPCRVGLLAAASATRLW